MSRANDLVAMFASSVVFSFVASVAALSVAGVITW